MRANEPEGDNRMKENQKEECFERSSKSHIVLSLYDRLLSGKPISKVSCAEEEGISYRTFDRYIAEIRCFLTDERYDLDLVFDPHASSYYIKNVTIHDSNR